MKTKLRYEDTGDGFVEEVMVMLCDCEGCERPATVTVRLDNGDLMFMCSDHVEVV
jgi:hypothetical protein